MKLRLPKSLLVAMLAIGGVAYSAVPFVEQEVIDVETDTTADQAMLDKLAAPPFAGSTNEHPLAIVKDGTANLTIDQDLTLNNPLVVREGQVTIAQAVVSNNTPLNNYVCNLSVGGNNAKLLLQNGTYKQTIQGSNNYTSSIAIGTGDGSGSVELAQNSTMHTDHCVFIGYHPTTILPNSYVSCTEDAQGNRYTNPNPADPGRSSLLVQGGSEFSAGQWTQLANADVTISGVGSKFTDGTRQLGNGDYYTYFGAANSTLNFTIADGGTFHTYHHVVAGYAENSQANILVTGAGSNMTIAADRELILGGRSSWSSQKPGGTTSLVVEKGASVSFERAFIGDATKTQVLIGEGSSYTGSHLTIGSEGLVHNAGSMTLDTVEMSGGVFNNAGELTIHNAVTIADSAEFHMLQGGSINGAMPTGGTYVYTLTLANLRVAANTLTGTYDSAAPMNIRLAAAGNLRAGHYMLLDATTARDTNTTGAQAIFEVEGLGATPGDIQWEDGILYFHLPHQLILVRDPLADAVQAANWGVYHSSQAFTSLLWAPHTNAVRLISPGTDAKGIALPAQARGYSLLWASAYSRFADHGGSNGFADTDYSIVGGALGAEHRFAGGSSIGLAFGYDWGKASPTGTKNVDQQSMHAALYGRAMQTNWGQHDSLALDWSAAVGQTESDHPHAGGDWTQNSMQLDARLCHIHAFSDRTSLNTFVGLQYYAHNDDSTDRLHADSMQNLRAQFGMGIARKMGEDATVFAQASVYRDLMRHNPKVEVDGFRYGSGANPGRTGGSFTVGAEYALNRDWTLRGSYTFDVAEHLRQHNLNLGAVYSF